MKSVVYCESVGLITVCSIYCYPTSIATGFDENATSYKIIICCVNFNLRLVQNAPQNYYFVFLLDTIFHFKTITRLLVAK